MKTLYISDLDGTLLNSSAKLSEFSKNALVELSNREIYFTVATARSPYSVRSILNGIPISVPCILMNGVLTYDIMTNTFVEVNEIMPQAFRTVLSAIREEKLSCFIYFVKDNKLSSYYESILNANMQAFYDERKNKYGRSFVRVDKLEDIVPSGIIYFTMLYTREELLPLYERVSEVPNISCSFYKDVYSEKLWYLEIFSSRATKYNSTLRLKEQYGFDRIVGFGDSHNDIPLFNACDECYAVENAADELKAYADGILGSNDSDSVAKFMLDVSK